MNTHPAFYEPVWIGKGNIFDWHSGRVWVDPIVYAKTIDGIAMEALRGIR